MHTNTIAIISDDLSCRLTMRSMLAEAGCAVLEYDTSMLEVPLGGADAVCLNIVDESGFRVLERLCSADAELPVIVAGQSGIVNRAMNLGGYDFIAMPLDGVAFRRSVAHAVEKRQLTEKVRHLSSQLQSQESEEIVPLRELERQAIARALRATKGSVTKAAKLLGIGRATLYRRLASPEMAALRPRRGYPSAPRPPASTAMAGNNGSALVAVGDPR